MAFAGIKNEGLDKAARSRIALLQLGLAPGTGQQGLAAVIAAREAGAACIIISWNSPMAKSKYCRASARSSG